MSLFEDTNPRELKEMLSQIHSRETALPDFQRDFVWDPNATQELIVSIAYNYPAGSLLRIRNTHDLFACREFQGAPELNGHRITYLVLDGQQRLTSLYQAFYGVGEHRYFVSLMKLMEGADFEDCILHHRANDRKAKYFEDPAVQARELILPLRVLKGGAGEFGRWSRAAARQRGQDRERIELEDRLSEIEEGWIGVIDDYKFPVVTLSDATGAAAVCTIFETLNRTGVKLSPFELLTARFWPKKVNLRQLWAKAKDDYPIIADFGVDPYYVMQIAALVSRGAPSCKRKDVLDLESAVVEEWWERCVWALSEGLELLRDDCGVITPGWLPYNTILIPLAAVLAKLALAGSPAVGANRQKLARWFWCAALGQAYENSPNSQAATDMVELISWLSGSGGPPQTVEGFRFDPRILRDTTGRQRAVYRGTICLILTGSPRDFHSAAELTGDLITEHNVDDHHIFPQAYLERLDAPPAARLRDCVLNRTLIDRKTNIRISDRAPSDYMAEIRKTYEGDVDLGIGKFEDLIESHLLPTAENSPLWRDDFESFLAWRQKAIWGRIQKLTGVREASDLLSEEVA